MSAPSAFTDADLRAYLAGEAPDAVRLALDAALETDEALGARLMALDEMGEAIAPAFAPVLAAAPTARLEADFAKLAPKQAAVASPSRRWALGAAAASIAAFGLGLWTGQGPRAPPPPAPAPPAPQPVPDPAPARPAWLAAVAGYVKLYSAETFQAAPLPPVQRTRALAALGAGVGLDLTALSQLEGLQLQRAELLQLKGRPLGQVAYLDEMGQPLAICILVRPPPKTPAPKPAAPSFTEDAIEDLRIVHWDVQPYGFLVIGRQDHATLRAIAAQAAARLG